MLLNRLLKNISMNDIGATEWAAIVDSVPTVYEYMGVFLRVAAHIMLVYIGMRAIGIVLCLFTKK